MYDYEPTKIGHNFRKLMRIKKYRGFKKSLIIENKKIIFRNIETSLTLNYPKEFESVICERDC